MAELEEERKKLRDILRESLILMADIEKMEECIADLRKRAVEVYKEIDVKLNGD